MRSFDCNSKQPEGLKQGAMMVYGAYEIFLPLGQVHLNE